MLKTSSHALSTSRKPTTGFLVKCFGECWVSTVLTVSCYWPSSSLYSCSDVCPCRESYIMTVHRWCWSLARVCVVTTSSHS